MDGIAKPRPEDDREDTVVSRPVWLGYRSRRMARRPLGRLREICLALPEAYEETTWGDATFRVRKKIFASAADHTERCTVSMKADRGEQAALLAQGPPFFFPSYVGSKGWIGVDLTSPVVDWDEVNELVRESYRLVAPKGLAARVE